MPHQLWELEPKALPRIPPRSLRGPPRCPHTQTRFDSETAHNRRLGHVGIGSAHGIPDNVNVAHEASPPGSIPQSRIAGNLDRVSVDWRRVAGLSVAGWSSLVAHEAHNLKVDGSNPSPAPRSCHVRRGGHEGTLAAVAWDAASSQDTLCPCALGQMPILRATRTRRLAAMTPDFLMVSLPV